MQQPLDRPRRHTFRDAPQPTVAGQGFGRNARHLDREAAFFIIGCDIGQSRRQPAPASPRLALRPDHPAAHFDRFLSGQRGGEHRIGGVEQMMSFVKDDPRRAADFVAAACGVDHHQRVVGDDDIRLHRGACRPFDEAFLVMRASGIDALAPPVGQRGRPVAAEQRGQPAGQIPADHIAIAAIGRPARHQMRQRRRPSGKAALQRVFQIQQAQIIFAALAHHDLLLEAFGVPG